MRAAEGVRRGVLLLAAGEATTRLLGFALSAVIARQAGLDALAALTVAQGLVAYAVVAGDAGLSTDAVRRLAAGRDPRSEVVVLTTVAQSGLTVLATLVLLAVVAVLPVGEQSKQAVLALSLLPLSYALNLGYVLQSASRFTVLTAGRIAGQVCGVAVGLVLLLRFDAFLLAVASLVLGAFVTDVLLAWACRADLRPLPRVTLRAVSDRIRQGRGFVGYTLANHASSSTSLLVVAVVGSATAVAQYSVAHRVLFLALAPAQVLAAVLLPRFSRREHVLDTDHWSLVASVVVVATGGATALLAFAGPVVGTLFGPAAVAAAPVVRAVAVFLPVAYLSLLLTTTLLSRGRAATQAVITSASLVPLLLLTAALVAGHGAAGPVYGVLAVEVGVVCAVARALRAPWRRLLRMALVSALLAAVVAGAVAVASSRTGSLPLQAVVWAAALALSLDLALRAAGGRPLRVLVLPSSR